MVKLVVCYGAPEDPADFDRHYTETHVPLVHKIPNLQRFEHGKVLGSPDGTAAPYYYMARALGSRVPNTCRPGWRAPRDRRPGADVATFASGGATLMVAEAL